MNHEKHTAIPTARPRCYLVYALAPAGVAAAEANRTINALIGDPDIPLALWHDHFLGGPGGCIVFHVENDDQQQALFNNHYLADWHADYRPMVFSFNPAAFDAQIAYTVNSYSEFNWDSIKIEQRPDYGGRDIRQEAETAQES